MYARHAVFCKDSTRKDTNNFNISPNMSEAQDNYTTPKPEFGNFTIHAFC
jgi:hypothetical protein